MRSYLIPYRERSSNDSMMRRIAPTLAETSGHCTHIVSIYSIDFLRSWVSSMFLAMLTRIWPNIKGKVAGLFSYHALMNLRHWYLSFATVGDLNSRSIKNPITTWIFSSFIIGAIYFDIFKIFLSTLMHVSLNVRSRSLKSSIFLNLG